MRQKVLLGLALGTLMLFCLKVAAGDWGTDFSKASGNAKTSGKYLLLNFSGSNWSGWSKKLQQEVFDQPEFQDYARQNLVCVLADFPRGKKQTTELKKQNAELAKKYSIKMYPTIILLSPRGDLITRTGYREGGSALYVKHLKELIGKHIDAEFDKIVSRESTDKELKTFSFERDISALMGEMEQYGKSGGTDRFAAALGCLKTLRDAHAEAGAQRNEAAVALLRRLADTPYAGKRLVEQYRAYLGESTVGIDAAFDRIMSRESTDKELKTFSFGPDISALMGEMEQYGKSGGTDRFAAALGCLKTLQDAHAEAGAQRYEAAIALVRRLADTPYGGKRLVEQYRAYLEKSAVAYGALSKVRAMQESWAQVTAVYDDAAKSDSYVSRLNPRTYRDSKIDGKLGDIIGILDTIQSTNADRARVGSEGTNSALVKSLEETVRILRQKLVVYLGSVKEVMSAPTEGWIPAIDSLTVVPVRNDVTELIETAYRLTAQLQGEST